MRVGIPGIVRVFKFLCRSAAATHVHANTRPHSRWHCRTHKPTHTHAAMLQAHMHRARQSVITSKAGMVSDHPVVAIVLLVCQTPSPSPSVVRRGQSRGTLMEPGSAHPMPRMCPLPWRARPPVGGGGKAVRVWSSSAFVPPQWCEVCQCS